MFGCKVFAPVALFFALQVACHPAVEHSIDKAPNELACSRDSFSVIENDRGIWPYREYKSSNATSPRFLIDSNGRELSDGLIFLTLANGGLFGYPGVKQQRPVIMSSEGDLIWAGPQGNTSNFRSQILHDKPVITYWKGVGVAAANGGAAHGFGSVEILNSKYEKIYSVCPKLDITFFPGTEFPCVADVHESYVTPHNTILVTVYNISQADLSSIGGPQDGWVYNPLAVEMDIATNKPIFIWNPLDHVPINSSHQPLMGTGQNTSNPYDWFHMNSIQPFKGNFLINSRQTWASYYVNWDGDILWQIDGLTGGDFGSLPENGNYSWQHNALLRDFADDQVLLTYFADNNGNILTNTTSVGLGLILDLPPNRNNTPKIYTHLVDANEPVYAYAEGSYTTVENGNYFVGYGDRPVLKEFGPDSNTGADVRWSAQFGYVNNNNTASSYRAFKQSWHATPSTKLSLVVGDAGADDALKHCAADSSKRGYVSWNGATGVTDYAVYAGSKKDDLQEEGKVARRGFETEFVVPQSAKYVQVAAIEGGSEVARSMIVVA